ncbi:hypothetical protein [Portibacter marinus]|nr:hypothetical protein [Portibacter marinus]
MKKGRNITFIVTEVHTDMIKISKIKNALDSKASSIVNALLSGAYVD